MKYININKCLSVRKKKSIEQCKHKRKKKFIILWNTF